MAKSGSCTLGYSLDIVTGSLRYTWLSLFNVKMVARARSAGMASFAAHSDIKACLEEPVSITKL